MLALDSAHVSLVNVQLVGQHAVTFDSKVTKLRSTLPSAVTGRLAWNKQEVEDDRPCCFEFFSDDIGEQISQAEQAFQMFPVQGGRSGRRTLSGATGRTLHLSVTGSFTVSAMEGANVSALKRQFSLNW